MKIILYKLEFSLQFFGKFGIFSIFILDFLQPTFRHIPDVMDFEKVKNPRNSSTQYFSICCWKNQKAKKAKNKISKVKKWKKVWKTEGHQFLYLMVCLTHVYMADIKHLLVLLNAQEGKHPCSKRLPFLRKWEAEGKRFLHQL